MLLRKPTVSVPTCWMETLPCLPPGTEAPEEWSGEVELALFRSPTLVEAAFLLRGPRALLLADAAFKMDASCGVPRGEIWQARSTGSCP